MCTKKQAEEFINNSRPAIEYLFCAIGKYKKILKKAKKEVGRKFNEIESSQQFFTNLFNDRDQWSYHANHYYAQYMIRMEELEIRKKEVKTKSAEKIMKDLINIGSTLESMSSLAGTVLQISKLALSLRYKGKPSLPLARHIGGQSIVEIIWEGRNHSMHWDESKPREKVDSMLSKLPNMTSDTIQLGKNYSLIIIEALEWSESKRVISDLKLLVQ